MTIPRNALIIILETWDSGDSWGSTMTSLFSLADVITFALGEHAAGFMPSPFGPDSEDYLYSSLVSGLDGDPDVFVEGFTITADDVRYAYRVLSRYADMLKAAGLDY